MYVDLLSLGRPRPTITELPGPKVRATLPGGDPDVAWIRFRSALDPERLGSDLRALIALDVTARQGWIDTQGLAMEIQNEPVIAASTLDELEAATADGAPVLVQVDGQPDGRADLAYTLSDEVRRRLGRRAQRVATVGSRRSLLLRYAQRFGRISSTEAASLAGVSPALVSDVLKELEEDGELVPSRTNRRGRGFHYRAAP